MDRRRDEDGRSGPGTAAGRGPSGGSAAPVRRVGLTSRARAWVLGLALTLPGCRSAPPAPGPWEREPDLYRAHPRLWLAHQPGARRAVDFAEHPAGGFTMATEAHGFREDGTVATRPPGPRVLLVGDSHLAGVVENRETAAAVLERRLGVEVVNGATGYWGPDQYAAFFAEWVGPGAATAELGATACLAVVYLGNDLVDTLATAERAGALRLPRPADHGDRLVRAWERAGEAVPQLLNQDAVLDLRPDLGPTAVDRTVAALVAARDRCAPRFFGVVLLPTRLDVDPAAEAAVGAGRLALGLAPGAVGAHRRLGGALADQLGAAGVPVLDPTAVLQGAHRPERPVFWTTDWHLAVQGHAALAGAIAAAWGDRLRAVPGD